MKAGNVLDLNAFWDSNPLFMFSMKTCTKCEQTFDESRFNKRVGSSDGLRGTCKECSRKQCRESYRKNAEYYRKKSKSRRREVYEWTWNLKEKHPCPDCGKKYPHYVMDFDHLEDHEKEFNISAEISRKGFDQIKQEIEKCEVVCSNCHRIRTWQRKHENSGAWCIWKHLRP